MTPEARRILHEAAREDAERHLERAQATLQKAKDREVIRKEVAPDDDVLIRHSRGMQRSAEPRVKPPEPEQDDEPQPPCTCGGRCHPVQTNTSSADDAGEPAAEHLARTMRKTAEDLAQALEDERKFVDGKFRELWVEVSKLRIMVGELRLALKAGAHPGATLDMHAERLN